MVHQCDVAAFTAVYERHHQALYRYCRSILQHEEDARDALQNTMTKAFAALRDEQRDIDLRPWLFRIAHNEAISIVRRRRPTCELESHSLAGPGSLPEQAADRERLSHLRADLNDLPDNQRIALVLRELNGLGHKEIAAVLECPIASVKQAIFEARTALHDFEQGRAMACDEIQRKLSDSDGRVLRGRRLRAHLRSCRSCEQFSLSLVQRPAALAMLAPPLPLAASTMLLHHLLPAAKAAAAGGGASAAGVGGGVAAGVATKSLLAVAAAVVVAGGAKAELTTHHAAKPAAASATAAAPKPKATARRVEIRRPGAPHAHRRRGAAGSAPPAQAVERVTAPDTSRGPSSPSSVDAPASTAAPPAIPAEAEHGRAQTPEGVGKPPTPAHGPPVHPGKPSTPMPAAADHGKSEAHKPSGMPRAVPPQAGPPQGVTPGTPPANPGHSENSAPGQAPTRQHEKSVQP